MEGKTTARSGPVGPYERRGADLARDLIAYLTAEAEGGPDPGNGGTNRSEDGVWELMEAVWKKDTEEMVNAYNRIEDKDEAIKILSAWGVALFLTLANVLGSDKDRLWRMMMIGARRIYGNHKQDT